ncbi:hypothetical protein V1477_013308 [Vespula maculifrons]|uniref:Uncharacterized protein n=1 Tax=Vespula maculifrons TaxID=7453 RepID=A0ABD2BW26_VESMC
MSRKLIVFCRTKSFCNNWSTCLSTAKIIGFTKRNGKTCQRCINFCSDIDASQKGTNDNIDIILNKEPGEQLLEMFQLLEKDV